MSELEFANLNWIHAIWLVAVLGVAVILLELRIRARNARFVSSIMLPKLARTTPRVSSLVSHSLRTLGLACFVIALMRPQYGFTEKVMPQVGAQVMICMDVSKSMLAEDTAPNRLERSKSELEVLLGQLQGDQVGLIAFAGKATVLSPLTTDFAFLRLLLREATPASVGRGGTLLEKPIRRALAGFSDENGMSKVIILITDGEDNGSKPLDAARDAAERGVRVITIGFGDESGTRIGITDHRTGLTSYIKDLEGNDVLSRLDVGLLTQIAKLTDGAFIPAGIGSLDVESIHRDHLAPLMRSTTSSTQIVKNEAYQWPLVTGLAVLILALLVANPLAFSRTRFGDWLESRQVPKSVVLLLVLLTGSPACAQQPTDAEGAPPENKLPADRGGRPITAKVENSPEEDEVGGGFSSRTLEGLVPEDPLECYNRACDLLQSDTVFAEKLLEASRRGAADNAELRFRASYNLGWAKITQSNRQLKERPEEALKNLQTAASWFRESVRLRPKNLPARENLEIVMQKIAALTDSLNRQEPQDFAKQLDELIKRQSERVSVTRRLLEDERKGNATALSGDQRDQAFRLASVDQRLLASDLQDASRKASQQVTEMERLQNRGNTKGAEPDSENAVRIAQFHRALEYADRAAQRLGQARSQLRLKNAERASLRTALGLDELKRARDQLRNPAEILRQIAADTRLLNQQTRALNSGKNSVAAFLGTAASLPEWLTVDYLKQFQTTQQERAAELAAVLGAAVLGAAASSSEKVSDPAAVGELPKETGKRLIGKAVEYVSSACQKLADGEAELGLGKPRKAEPLQEQALADLLRAYELFADLRGLLELSHATQVKLNRDLRAATNLPENLQRQVSPELLDQLSRNIERCKRVDELIDQQVQQQATTSSVENKSPSGNAEPEDSAAAEQQKLALARKLIEEIRTGLGRLDSHLRPLATGEPTNLPWTEIHADGKNIAEQIDQLRRLFFSIVEHLRETADRQKTLMEETRELLEEFPSEQKQKLASTLPPLNSRQRELASIAGQIADVLMESGNPPAKPPLNAAAPGTGSNPNPGEEEMRKKYRAAGALVKEGKEKMYQTIKSMDPAGLDRKNLLQAQEEALEKLSAALQLLSPDPGKNQQEQENKSSSSQPQSGESANDPANTEQNGLLQGIRDREANRRKQKKQNRFQQRVEKDW
ncbi:MAG: VWA domain-containing protein [Planctomycetota bacterium]|nr:VWA domain-containing protein [Planctomycetota bacterium]